MGMNWLAPLRLNKGKSTTLPLKNLTLHKNSTNFLIIHAHFLLDSLPA